ncbi:MAG: amidohydrolase family protein, partial [Gemmatimonadota bacterium]
MVRAATILGAVLLAAAPAAGAGPEAFDLVLANGRVMDPESALDAVRHVGIRNGKIAAVSAEPLAGDEVLDVTGLVVAPGFIDLHAHGQDPVTFGILARDGVTTALEMEGGVLPVAEWYEERAGKRRLNYGAAVSHPGARFEVLEEDAELDNGLGSSDAWSHQPASAEEIEQIAAVVDQGLAEGAIGIGFGIQYTPAATRDEIWRVYKVGEKHGVTGFAHVRFAAMAEPGSSVESVQEMIAIAATGPSVHICHLPSTGLGKVPILLEMIDAAQERGIDVTTEAYPYVASSSFIGAAILDPGWRERLGRDYGDIGWAATGERLTEKTFHRYREEQPNGTIIAYVMEEENVVKAMAHPTVMIAADGGDLSSGKGHPRSAGSHARVLGVYVRDKGVMSLMDAIAKMTLLPAQRMETAVPGMRDRGRIRVGAHADITIFDPERVIDRATFESPAEMSEGIPHMLVGGTFVVRDSELVEGATPGQPIRRE